MRVSESKTNEHGVVINSPAIFQWDEIERVKSMSGGQVGQLLSGEHMHLVRAVYPPGATYALHSHPHEQFSVLLSGRLRLTVGDETRDIAAGDGWYAAANVPHGGVVLGDESAVFVDVYAPATRWIVDLFAERTPLPSLKEVEATD